MTISGNVINNGRGTLQDGSSQNAEGDEDVQSGKAGDLSDVAAVDYEQVMGLIRWVLDEISWIFRDKNKKYN